MKMSILFCGHKLGPQNSISKVRSFPYAFTEQGVAMLATILRTDVAVGVSIKIMDALVEMRKFIANNGQVFQEINTIKSRLQEHDIKFDKVFNELQKMKKKKLE